MKLTSATLTKPGGKAQPPQDACGLSAAGDAMACWALADAHGSGGEAAQSTVKHLRRHFLENPAMSPSLLTHVFELAQHDLLGKHSRAAVSAALLCSGGRSVLWAHVGNVRVYAFRNGRIAARTRDHSAAQALAEAGKISASDIRQHDERRSVLRHLGSAQKVQPSVTAQKFVLQAGDGFLLCTDGFWEHVTELEMLIDWSKSQTPAAWLQWMEARLSQRAPLADDSYSAIALWAEA